MYALLLDQPGHLSLHEIPKTDPGAHEVRIRVNAVCVCGTDFHIFAGHANYNLDARKLPIPLESVPQVMGHEFCGTIEALGAGVRRWIPGERVVVDQVRTCISERRDSVCEFCESGDSHQCENGREHGITGIPGAFAEYVCVPEANVIPVPRGLADLAAALVEPLGCVLHSIDRMQHAEHRYSFEGRRRIRSILILGGGPAGLLFLQCLRNLFGFEGRVVVADVRPASLELAARFGGHAVHVSGPDPAAKVLEANGGAAFECIVEATGNGTVFEWLPRVARRQATLVLYGAGHGNLKDGCLIPWQALEFSVATSAGASGKTGPDGTPLIYASALSAIASGRIRVEEMVTHRYPHLESLVQAFTTDSRKPDYVKGVMVLPH